MDMDKINNFMQKRLFINDTLQITMGRLMLVIFVTMFQALGIWSENGWVICPSMFFLFANMFLALGKSTRPEEEKKRARKKKKEELAKTNRSLIVTLTKEVYELKKIINKMGEK